VGVFLGLQCFRVVEPLSLHLTRGYWGSATHAGGGEMLARLAGSPYDVINPNGLAFVIVTIISIAHFWPPRKGQPIMHLLYWGAVALLLYALVLSQSRTGYLALVVVLLIIVIKSDNRAIGLALVAVCLVGLVSQLDTLSIERILSLARSDVRFAGSARSRIDGVFADLQVALSGPIFGYGIGTSLEANVNLRGTALPAHNLYVEILQELGFIGVALFLWYMVAIARTIRSGLQESRHLSATASSAILHGLDAWYWMNLLFSFASYGLSSYEWYLIGGLAVAAYTQQVQSAPSESREAAPSAAAIPGPWEQ
jgi:O-antigen ligase